MGTILIVDDDDQLRESFSRLLIEEGHEVRTAPSGEAGIESVKKSLPDLVVQDVKLPGIDGLTAFARIREIDANLPVIVMTAFGTTETAIEATKLGAFDYIPKPFDIADMLQLIQQALDAGRLMRSRVEMGAGPDEAKEDAIIGNSRAMQEVYKNIGRVAATDATVLIRGESGTGKELVARAVYQHSKQSDKPFTVINCVALPETLLESELFGYEKGAFTGAANRRIGKIEQANDGTVFLDEIGDMPLSIQAKILRLLQEQTIERLGGNRPIPVDVRIIAATNRNLERSIENETFREDLYYRLKVVTISLPPLREREEDVSLLCDYFMARFSREIGIYNPGMADDARSVVNTHTWPGNVRELGNTIKKALIFSRGYPIRPEDISQVLSVPTEGDAAPDAAAVTTNRNAPVNGIDRQWVRQILQSESQNDKFNHLIDRFTGIVISEALQLTGGNRSQAARLLGLARPTLLSKIEKLNLTIETKVQSGDNE
ncbi:MAG: sigma-54 dependent transcriptional regulator [Thermodesulfobacteriota bacterium]|nr:sigma-54 dependent transcriptional regulator [Thermodesulfobacteriota bacterium]